VFTVPEELHNVVLYEGSLVWIKCQARKMIGCDLFIQFRDSPTWEKAHNEVLMMQLNTRNEYDKESSLSIRSPGLKKLDSRTMIPGSKLDLRALITSRELIIFNGHDTIIRFSFQDLWGKWDQVSHAMSTDILVYLVEMGDPAFGARSAIEQLRWGGRKGGYPMPTFVRKLTSIGLQSGESIL